MSLAERKPDRSYDVALSFAGEDRAYVEQVAAHLKTQGTKVFYDAYEEISLWGKNLYTHLSDVYANQAIFTVIFISDSYSKKLWTNHERESAQSRAFEESKEYILPARFDDTKISGILPTVGFIDLRTKKPAKFAEMIEKKLKDAGVRLTEKPRFVDLGPTDSISCHHPHTAYPDGYSSLRIAVHSDNTESVSRAFSFIPGRYKTIHDLLNEIYYNYLHKYVSPLSYGSEWIIESDGFMPSPVAPIEWIYAQNQPIHRVVKSDWYGTSPSLLGISEGSSWHIDLAKDDLKDSNIVNFSRFDKKYLVVATNNIELVSILRREPKSYIILFDANKLKAIPARNFDQGQFLYATIIRDWIGHSRNLEDIVLVDNGVDTSEFGKRYGFDPI